jgi:ribosomal protein S12 methylthiotransferase accessory factor
MAEPRQDRHGTARADAGVALFGEGLLADAIAGSFAGVHRVGRVDPAAIPEDRRIVVASSDRWDTRDHPALRKAGIDRGLAWLPVRTELGRVVIGPVERAGWIGCAECAELRRARARSHPQGHAAVWERHGPTIAEQPSSLLTGLAADIVAGLVGEEVRSLATDPDSARTRCGMLYVDLHTLHVSEHRFLADPRCPECGGMPADGASLARIELRPRPKTAPDRYRVRAVADEIDALRRIYIDQETGMVREIRLGDEGGVAIASAHMALRNGQVENGFGRTRSYRDSELSALLEGLERYGGIEPGGKRTTVSASYREVLGSAIDPRDLGGHPADFYKRPGSRFKPFDENRPYLWVWAYSFAEQAPILVPERSAYYWLSDLRSEPAPFMMDSSNGCALGSCLEEAVLHGILEVAERDAFLMTWYTRMRVPRIDPSAARRHAIPTIINGLETDTGYRVVIFDTTLEQGIPCCVALAFDPAEEPDGPKMVCAAAAHLDPEQAIENALSELGPMLASHIADFPEERAKAREMAMDPSLVRTVADHSLLYCDPTVSDRVPFLADSAAVRSIADLPRPEDFRNDDLSDDLRQVIGRYTDRGMDVIVVDQTTPEHQAGGFSCVKVIIPGTLPMTFGYHDRRIEGLPRLFEVPRLLGYCDRLLDAADINPHPHPFS